MSIADEFKPVSVPSEEVYRHLKLARAEEPAF